MAGQSMLAEEKGMRGRGIATRRMSWASEARRRASGSFDERFRLFPAFHALMNSSGSFANLPVCPAPPAITGGFFVYILPGALAGSAHRDAVRPC